MRQSTKERCILCYSPTGSQDDGQTAYTINKARVNRINGVTEVLCKLLNLPFDQYQDKLTKAADICFNCQSRVEECGQEFFELERIQRRLDEIKNGVEDLLLESYRVSNATAYPLDTRRSIILRNEMIKDLDLTTKTQSIKIVSISSLQSPSRPSDNSSYGFYDSATGSINHSIEASENELIIPDIIDVRTGRGYQSDPDFEIEQHVSEDNSNGSDWTPNQPEVVSLRSRRGRTLKPTKMYEPVVTTAPPKVYKIVNRSQVTTPYSTPAFNPTIVSTSSINVQQAGAVGKALKSTGRPAQQVIQQQQQQLRVTPSAQTYPGLRKRKIGSDEPEIISLDSEPQPSTSSASASHNGPKIITKPGPASWKKKIVSKPPTNPIKPKAKDDDFDITSETIREKEKEKEDDTKCPYTGLRCNICLSYSHTKLDLAKHLRFRHRKHWKTCEICKEEFKGLDLGPEPPEIPERVVPPKEKGKELKIADVRSSSSRLSKKPVEITIPESSEDEDDDGFAGNREWKCDECDEKFKSEKKLDKHQWDKHLGNPFQCDLCTNSYATKEEYDDHIEKEHTGPKARNLTSSTAINGQAKTTTTTTTSFEIKSTYDGPILCDLCADAFPSQKALAKHMQGHNETQDFLDLIDKSRSNSTTITINEKDKESSTTTGVDKVKNRTSIAAKSDHDKSMEDFLVQSGIQLDFSNLSNLNSLDDSFSGLF